MAIPLPQSWSYKDKEIPSNTQFVTSTWQLLFTKRPPQKPPLTNFRSTFVKRQSRTVAYVSAAVQPSATAPSGFPDRNPFLNSMRSMVRGWAPVA